MSDTFWVLVLASWCCSRSSSALGALDPGEVVVADPRGRSCSRCCGPRTPSGTPAIATGVTPRRSATASGGASELRTARPRDRGDPRGDARDRRAAGARGPGRPGARRPRGGDRAHVGPGEAVAEVRDLEIPAPRGAIPVRLYRPGGGGPRRSSSTSTAAAGWSARLDSFDTVVRALANAAGAVVAQRRLPARARGPVPGRARRRATPRCAGSPRTRPSSAPTRAARGRRRQRGRQPRRGRRAAPARRAATCALPSC